MKNHYYFRHLFLLLALVIIFGTTRAQTVFVSSKGKKYHTETCGGLGSDKHGLAVDEAKKQGYKACRKCKVKSAVAAQRRKEGEDKH